MGVLPFAFCVLRFAFFPCPFSFSLFPFSVSMARLLCFGLEAGKARPKDIGP